MSIIRIGLLWATFISTQNVFLLKYESLFPFWEYLVVLRILEINVYYSKNDDDAFLLGRTSNTIIFVMWWSRWYDMTCMDYLFEVWIAVLIYFTLLLSFWEWSEVPLQDLIIISIRSSKIIIFNCSQQELYIRDWGLL